MTTKEEARVAAEDYFNMARKSSSTVFIGGKEVMLVPVELLALIIENERKPQ